jgi:hypothetical protein
VEKSITLSARFFNSKFLPCTTVRLRAHLHCRTADFLPHELDSEKASIKS